MKTRIDLQKDWVRETTENGVCFKFPAEEGAGYRPYGFDKVNDAAENVMRWYGMRFEVVTNMVNAEVMVTAGFYEGMTLCRTMHFASAGNHTFDVSFKEFPIESAKTNQWRDLVFIEISGVKEVCHAELLRGNGLYVETGVLGKSGAISEQVSYTVKVHNCTEQETSVMAYQMFGGWESMVATIAPDSFCLAPYGEQDVTVTVEVHDYMPAGAHEKTTVRFVPEGNSAQATEVTFTTLSRLQHPYIYHTEEKWKEVKEKVERYEVFKPSFEQMKKDADGWKVPAIVPFGERDYCFDTKQEHYILACAYMYALTKENCYAEKVVTFFRSFIDEEIGYPVRKKGCSQAYVQEGGFFQHLALAYDIVYDSPSWTEEDRAGVEKCFRIYMEILDWHICRGHISNWILAEVTGAVYCAMVLQDFERMERFLEGDSGTFEQLRYGAFSDGWWYECSVSYNTWVSSMFLHTAHALLPFGINILHKQFPLSYGKEVSSNFANTPAQVRFGMYNEKWGGIQKSYICIKDLFDAVVPFLDYRGVLFGISDSAEKKIGNANYGSTFDLAYTHYQDPAYLPIIKRADEIDLLFGHAGLPESETEPGIESAYSDNIGILMLRSHTKNRETKEQIQAVLRYGSHGYAHGHFDRTELLSVMRYGRSFFNPESIWWSYGHFLYKFYVQNSNTKNMVVVDGKLQIPADAQRILFYGGKTFQAGAVRTNSKWGFPPFGGMIYDDNESLKDRCEINASDLPNYDAAEYGKITEETEPIRQTRTMVVLDDCIVLFDCVEGETEHLYESLMEVKGLQSLTPVYENGTIKSVCHTGKKSDDPRSDTQFITDCYWYEADGETVAKFETKFGEGADNRGSLGNYNEPGSLHMDVYTAWPHKTQQMHGLGAEQHGIRVPYWMKVTAGDECLTEYSANAWLLGARELQLQIPADSKELKLEIFNKPLYSEQKYPYRGPQGLFIADAYLELTNGERVRLSEISLNRVNIDEGYGIGKDYEGGRVLIEGIEYADAIPVSPTDHEVSAFLTADLTGLQVVSFHAIVGADHFPGAEAERRRHYAVGQYGVEGRFVTVIEPHEGSASVASVSGISEETVRIVYKDGSTQEVTVMGLKDTPAVSVKTCRDGSVEEEHS